MTVNKRLVPVTIPSCELPICIVGFEAESNGKEIKKLTTFLNVYNFFFEIESDQNTAAVTA